MRVSIVIPNWNGRSHLERLLPSIFNQTAPPSELLVVDNGSTDGSAEWAAAAGATLIRFSHNAGFARAVNTGIDKALGDAVAVLNNDVVLRPDWLERTSAALTVNHRSFIVGKLLRAADPRQLDGSFDLLCRGGAAWRAGHGRHDGPRWSEGRPIQFPPFTAVLIRRADFLSVGGLDEDYGSYLEDVDFGFRCASSGYTGWYSPDAIATHEGSATLGRWHSKTVRQIARNQVLLVARHYPRDLLLRFGWPIAIAQLLWGVVALKHGAAGPWLLGKIDAVRAFSSWRRRGTQHLSTVLETSERELRALQAESGQDWFWRIYFALT